MSESFTRREVSWMAVAERIAPRQLPDHLLAHGRPVVTLEEASELMGLGPNAAADALVRLRRAGTMFSPSRGLYVAIPPQYRTWRTVPALDFIDPMMRANDRNYYVALLSAAELHGASHQRPQIFQVMVDRLLEDRDFDRVRIRFYSRQRLRDVPVVLINSSADQVKVSSPAATALDLASRPAEGGGLSNVATVVHDLVENANLTVQDLLDASGAFPSSSLRRLGWLLDISSAPLDLDLVAARLALEPKTRASVLLDARGPRRGPGNRRWGVVVNADVEPDL